MASERFRGIVTRLGYRNTGHKGISVPNPGATNMVKRIKPASGGFKGISTESVDFKAPISAKAKQSWKYAGGSIVRSPDVTINGTEYTDHDRPGQDSGLARRKQESNFFITINSNKAPESAEGINTALMAMDKMLKGLSKESVMATYIKFGPKHDHYREDKFADVIGGIDWKAASETGPTHGKVHSHIWLTITHYSQIQINVQMLMYQSKRLYNQNVLLKADKITRQPYVHVKLLPQSNWTDVMRQYIHKGMNIG